MLLHLIVKILFVSRFSFAESLNNHEINPQTKDNEHPDDTVSHCLQQTTPEALWIPETGVLQDLGMDQIPEQVQIQLRETICDMNDYSVRSKTVLQSADRLKRCQNQQPLCAFWALQGQCTNYRKYMERMCPVACRLCHTELFRARAWLDFLEELEHIYHADPSDNVVVQRQRVFDTFMNRLGMPHNRSGLFAEELMRRLEAVIPSFLTRLYLKDLSEQEADWLRHLYEIDPNISMRQVQVAVLVQYRERGYMVRVMEATDHLILRPIQLSIAFAIPNQRALQTIRDLNMPIVEMGAGSGYWTALLQTMGVSVAAYDASRGQDNAFFDVWYTDQIQQGTCEYVMNRQLAQTHALLMIWPNDPDPVDHPQFCHGDACQDSEPVWDAACLQRYMELGGHTVIYVGERQHVLQERYGTKESGMSSTLQFQRLLEESFDLQTVVPIPRLWLNDDDLTVWTRKISKGEL